MQRICCSSGSGCTAVVQCSSSSGSDDYSLLPLALIDGEIPTPVCLSTSSNNSVCQQLACNKAAVVAVAVVVATVVVLVLVVVVAFVAVFVAVVVAVVVVVFIAVVVSVVVVVLVLDAVVVVVAR